MASHWIKMRTTLSTDTRVLSMADALFETARTYVLLPEARDLLGVTPPVTRDVMRDVTIASLHRVWSAANDHTADGVFRNATLQHLDTISGVPGFGSAMQASGWVVYDPANHTLTLPNFLEYNTPAKGGRSPSAIRSKRSRDKKRAEKEQLQERSEGVTRHGSRDVSPLISSPLISSEEEGTNNILLPQSTAQQLEALKIRINNLRPATWRKLAVWGSEDDRELIAARENLLALSDQDWLLLAWFCEQVDGASNGNNNRQELKLTAQRGLFCQGIAGILTRAQAHWGQSGRPRLGPKPPANDPSKKTDVKPGDTVPETPPLPAADFIQALRKPA